MSVKRCPKCGLYPRIYFDSQLAATVIRCGRESCARGGAHVSDRSMDAATALWNRLRWDPVSSRFALGAL